MSDPLKKSPVNSGAISKIAIYFIMAFFSFGISIFVTPQVIPTTAFLNSELFRIIFRDPSIEDARIVFIIFTSVGVVIVAGAIFFSILQLWLKREREGLAVVERRRARRLGAREDGVPPYEGEGDTKGVKIYDPEGSQRQAHDKLIFQKQQVYIVVDSLSLRINELKRQSSLIFWSILSVLTSGVLLIIFAGYLTSFDSMSERLWLRLDAGQNQIESAIRFSPGSLLPPGIMEAERARVDEAREFLIRDRNRIAEERRLLLLAQIEEMKERAASGRTLNLSVSIMRICIIGLLVFLTQILIQLYRYNSRMISFYVARRDAIVICGGEFKNLKQMIEMLAPSSVDFGREPTNPLVPISRFWPFRTRPSQTESAEGPSRSTQPGRAPAGPQRTSAP